MNGSKKNIRGAAMVEYVLIIGLIAAAAIPGISTVGTKMGDFFGDLSNIIAEATDNF